MPNFVMGHGPVLADICVVGEGPGRDEDLHGIPFCGMSGHVLDTYLLRWLMLDRSEVYVTNLVKYRCVDKDGQNRTPTDEEVARDSWILEDELKRVRPGFVLAIGLKAYHYLTGDLRPMHVVHGIPRWVEARGFWVLPCYHPAAGFRESYSAVRCLVDFQWAGEFIHHMTKGGACFKPWIDVPMLNERQRVGEAEFGSQESHVSGLTAAMKQRIVKFHIGPGDPQSTLAVDTEGDVSRPSHLSWAMDYRENVGFVYKGREVNADLVAHELLFHFWQHDARVLRAMKVRLSGKIIDTLTYSYLPRTEPGALKDLASRWYGIEGPEFPELAEPYIRAARMELLRYVDRWGQDHLMTDLSPKGKKLKVLRPISEATSRPELAAYKKAHAAVRDADAGKNVDLDSRWKAWKPEEKGVILAVAEEGGFHEWPPLHPDYVPDDVMVPYAAKDPCLNILVRKALDPYIDHMGLRHGLDTRMDTLPIISRIEEVGMRVERAHFQWLSAYFGSECDRLKQEITASAGPGWEEKLDVDNPESLSGFLFTDPRGARLRSNRLTPKKRRPSTDKKALEGLKDAKGDPLHPIVPRLKDYRELTKFKSTYVDPVLELAVWDEDGVYGTLYPHIKAHSLETFRWAAEDPNMLAIPKRSKRAKMVRDGFVARPGCVMASADESQGELRVLAHISEDPELIRVYREGRDLHEETSLRLFGTKDAEKRRDAKDINFGIVYGISPAGLYQQYVLRGSPYSYEDAEAHIAEWFRVYAGVGRYVRWVEEQVLRYGYIRSPLSGRIRYIPEAFYPDEYRRAKGFREAANFPIQEGLFYLVERWMKRVWDHLAMFRDDNKWAEILLAIHDSLELECEAELAPIVKAIVLAEAVRDQDRLKVPLDADWKQGVRWGELKEVEKAA